MTRGVHIFATKDDVLPGLQAVETELSIKYVRCGSLPEPRFSEFESLTQWPELGNALAHDHLSGAQFLVVPRNVTVVTERIDERDGTTRYTISRKATQARFALSQAASTRRVYSSAATSTRSPQRTWRCACTRSLLHELFGSSRRSGRIVSAPRRRS